MWYHVTADSAIKMKTWYSLIVKTTVKVYVIKYVTLETLYLWKQADKVCAIKNATPETLWDCYTHLRKMT